MVILIEAFLGIIVLLIILTSIVDIRFCYLEELEISIAFIFIKITFTINKGDKKGRGTHLGFLSALVRESFSTLRHTKVVMSRSDFSYTGNSPLRAILPPIFIPILATIIRVNAAEFSLTDNTGRLLDIGVKIHLFHLFIFAFKTLYYYLKYRKRGEANA